MEILIRAFNKINRVRKQRKDFFIKFVYALIGSHGKKTARNLSRYMEQEEHTISRQTAQEIDSVGLNAAMIQESKNQGDELIAAQDASFVEKSGKKTYGIDFFWNGTAGLVEKGLEADMIGIIRINGDKKEGYGLSVKQTPANPIPYTERKKLKKGKNAVTRIDSYLAHLQSVAPHLKKLGIKHIAADCLLNKDKYANGVVDAGFHLVSKLRSDAQLRRVYTGPQKPRGRKKKIDQARIRADDFENSPVITLTTDDGDHIELRSCLAYSVALKRTIKVVSVRKCESADKYREVYLSSTDTELASELIFRYYTARFQIEFVFRDAKGFTGFGDCQSRDPRRINYHFNASITALNVAKLQDYQLQKIANASFSFSMTNWSRKYLVEIIINRFIAMFGLDELAIKSHPNFQSMLTFGSIMH